MRYLFVVLVTLLTMACSKQWTHEQYSQERFKTDSDACDQQALEMTQRGSKRKEREMWNTCMTTRGWSQTRMPRLDPVKE